MTLRRLLDTTLPWHFGSLPRNPSMAVGTTIRDCWRSE
jgi:hypothetical protein